MGWRGIFLPEYGVTLGFENKRKFWGRKGEYRVYEHIQKKKRKSEEGGEFRKRKPKNRRNDEIDLYLAHPNRVNGSEKRFLRKVHQWEGKGEPDGESEPRKSREREGFGFGAKKENRTPGRGVSYNWVDKEKDRFPGSEMGVRRFGAKRMGGIRARI